jgi:hypothetical protein
MALHKRFRKEKKGGGEIACRNFEHKQAFSLYENNKYTNVMK